MQTCSYEYTECKHAISMTDRSYAALCILSQIEWSVCYHNFMNTAPTNLAPVAADICYP